MRVLRWNNSERPTKSWSKTGMPKQCPTVPFFSWGLVRFTVCLTNFNMRKNHLKSLSIPAQILKAQSIAYPTLLLLDFQSNFFRSLHKKLCLWLWSLFGCPSMTVSFEFEHNRSEKQHTATHALVDVAQRRFSTSFVPIHRSRIRQGRNYYTFKAQECQW